MNEPKQYRKKPVVIEAVQWDGTDESAGLIIEWAGGQIGMDRSVFEPRVNLAVRTLEGIMLAMPGDWIIRGVKGEFYPCKPDIFDATYESAQLDLRPISGEHHVMVDTPSWDTKVRCSCGEDFTSRAEFYKHGYEALSAQLGVSAVSGDEADRLRAWCDQVEAAYADGGYAAGDHPVPDVDDVRAVLAQLDVPAVSGSRPVPEPATGPCATCDGMGDVAVEFGETPLDYTTAPCSACGGSGVATTEGNET